MTTTTTTATTTTTTTTTTHLLGRVLVGVVALMSTIAGCDEGTRARPELHDQQALQERMAAKQGALTPEELREIAVAEPTVRDVLEGRVAAPMASRSFGLLDESGEVLTKCPQQDASLGAAPVEEGRAVGFDTTDELLLDTPLDQTCLAIDRDSGDALLVRCDDTAGLDDGAPLTIADWNEPSAAACYFCNFMAFCGSSWMAKKSGVIIGSTCYAIGHDGCC